MKVAIIPTFNDEATIGSIVKATKNFVNKILVIDDGSLDNTAKVASSAGAEVIRNEKKLGLSKSLIIASKEVGRWNPDIVITLDGDGQHNPSDIPELIASIERGEHDISIGTKDEVETGFRAFNAKAFFAIIERVEKRGKKPLVFSIISEEIQKLFRITRLFITPWYSPLEKFEEHVIDSVEKLKTPKEIYNKKRNIQKELSKIESYRLICVTFLKFIPPALLSLFISITIIMPATNIVNINLTTIVMLSLSIIITFFFCWGLLILLLDKIYEKSTFIEALDVRLKQIEREKFD